MCNICVIYIQQCVRLSYSIIRVIKLTIITSMRYMFDIYHYYCTVQHIHLPTTICYFVTTLLLLLAAVQN